MFVIAAVVLLLPALLFAAVPLWRRGRHTEAAFAGLFIAGTAIGVYLLIGRPDLALEPPVAGAPVDEQDVVAMVDQLAQRLEKSPDDPEGWTMLGRAYVMMGEYEGATKAFQQAIQRSSGDQPDLLASLAESRVLSNPAALEGEAGAMFERVLQLDPKNARALWYGGLRAQATGDTGTALERWQVLLGQDLPEGFRQVVEGRVASIDPAKVDALVTVEVALAPELAAALPANAVLFVFLRPQDDGSGGPPLAARRIEYFEFPEIFPVTRRNLLRGGELPPGPFTVTARLSVDDDAVAGTGDLEGSTSWDPANGERVSVMIDQQVGKN